MTAPTPPGGWADWADRNRDDPHPGYEPRGKAMLDRYPVSAPVFADAEADAETIGYALTAAQALALYVAYYAGGDLPARAVKVTPDRRGFGPVDGWAPQFAEGSAP